MKKAILILLLCDLTIALSAQRSIGSKRLTIDVNYNAELLGLAYFIGFEGVDIENQTVEINGRSIPKKEWHTYGFYIYEKYKKYAASENLAKSFAVADHLWLDSILYLLVQVDDFPHAQLTSDIDVKYFINFSKKKDSAEAKQNAKIFLDGLNSFYNEINFKQYISDTKSYYAAALNQVKSNLPKKDFIKAMETFYGKNFGKYTLVPSLTIPKGMGFGLKYAKNARTTLLNVFGAFDNQTLQQPDAPDLGFGNPQRLQELSIHEFGHSFVNPIIDAIPQEKISNTERLFEPIKSAMEKQGYNTWKVCLYEHFVRAGEVMIAKLLGDAAGSQRLRTNYVADRSFIYLPTIITALENYNKRKIQYYDAVINAISEIKQK